MINCFFKASVLLIFWGIIGLLNQGQTDVVLASDFGSMSDVSVLSCYDGDTCRFNIPGVHPIIGDNIAIRLDGIDTPEIRGRCLKEKQLAREARGFINGFFQDLSEKDRIDLMNLKRGKYFRLVATIIVHREHAQTTVNLNRLMVEKGYAVYYNGKRKSHDWCA